MNATVEAPCPYQPCTMVFDMNSVCNLAKHSKVRHFGKKQGEPLSQEEEDKLEEFKEELKEKKRKMITQ